jgi:hypothetical protein
VNNTLQLASHHERKFKCHLLRAQSYIMTEHKRTIDGNERVRMKFLQPRFSNSSFNFKDIISTLSCCTALFFARLQMLRIKQRVISQPPLSRINPGNSCRGHVERCMRSAHGLIRIIVVGLHSSYQVFRGRTQYVLLIYISES